MKPPKVFYKKSCFFNRCLPQMFCCKFSKFVIQFSYSATLWNTCDKWFVILVLQMFSLNEKCPNTEFFLVLIFLHLDWIQENTYQKKIHVWTIFTQCSSFISCLISSILIKNNIAEVINRHGTDTNGCKVVGNVYPGRGMVSFFINE